MARTIGDLCRGQVAELQTLYDLNRTEAQYFPSIAGKTASLFGAATRIGGIVAGRDRSIIDALTEFGRLYGMAFQVIDDILDVIATDEQLGKPAGKDMLEGVYSLPVIHTLASPAGPRLRELLIDGLSENDRMEALDVVRHGPGGRQRHAGGGRLRRAVAERDPGRGRQPRRPGPGRHGPAPPGLGAGGQGGLTQPVGGPRPARRGDPLDRWGGPRRGSGRRRPTNVVAMSSSPRAGQRLARLTAARISPPTRRSLLKGLLAYRWFTVIWALGVFTWQVWWRGASDDLSPVARPVAGFVLSGAAVGITTYLTVLYRRDPDRLLRPFPVYAEIAVGTIMLLADTWVYGSGDHPQTLPSVWVVGAVGAVAIAGGRRAAVATGAGMGLARYVGLIPFVGTSESTFRGLSTIVLLALSGWVLGYLLRRLSEADHSIAEYRTRESAYRAREEVARTLHDGVLQTLAVIQRRSDDGELVGLARSQEHELREYLFGDGPGGRPGHRHRRRRMDRRFAIGAGRRGLGSAGGRSTGRATPWPSGPGGGRPRPADRVGRDHPRGDRSGRRGAHQCGQARRGDGRHRLCRTGRRWDDLRVGQGRRRRVRHRRRRRG